MILKNHSGALNFIFTVYVMLYLSRFKKGARFIHLFIYYIKTRLLLTCEDKSKPVLMDFDPAVKHTVLYVLYIESK